MEKRPRCPRPPGVPRWVAMFHQPSRNSWTVAAESPHREPVLYAVGDMTQTVRARGEEATIALWGPKGDAWHLHDAPAAAPSSAPAASSAAAADGAAADGPAGPAVLAERMTDRRHQVLMAGLSKAGLYDLGPEDGEAVRVLADRLDEPTVRRVAHWLSVAGGQQ
ncbi:MULTISPECIES: hypothetical protein [unclassified Streptomyces]|uniref:hypothetical protein n=1 Tax=unclassified Streptomyces TaxID=2593676 RepID=UPI00093E17DD|nr:hypothetical protein [Streptomyces sp. CB01883]OKJ85957.1 hypothetical protein AMK32_01095 [Streptomyces sp. CB01883]